MFPVFQNRQKAIESVTKIEQLANIPKADDWKKSIEHHINNLNALIVQYEEDSKKENRDELQTQLKNFKAKQWVSQQRAAIESEMTRLQYAIVLSSAKKLTSTNAITKKKGEIAQSLITDAFVARFNNELKALGAAHINVELVKSRVAKGKVLHRIQLKNATQHSPENVLSEGERRIVSLSAFLADVSSKTHSAPFVFDDPISSLDQTFEEKVVQRLIDLSAEKQIIVFTHRLSLLGLMQDYANKAGVSTHVVCIRKEMWGTGEPGDTPLFAKKPLAALNKLRIERLSQAKKVLEVHGLEVYEPLAKALCSDFRIVIERMVECNLTSDIVQRYRRDIMTKNKIEHLSKITRADCQLFDDLMSKYSTYEHSQPLETPVSMPGPDDLKADFDRLAEWHVTFSARPIPENLSEEVAV
jgi:energy-coupling factor transporter ATP-binding protein EcfA2